MRRVDTASLSEETSVQNNSCMAHFVKGSHRFRNEPYLPLLSQSKLALIHPTWEGWKAELLRQHNDE